MKLEECLPLYREGKTLVSCLGNHYSTVGSEGLLLCQICSETELTGEWRVKQNLAKPYSVELWMANEPKSDSTSEYLESFVFGETGLTWNKVRNKNCQRKFRITVEEVEE
jgi:hypothetical protein